MPTSDAHPPGAVVVVPFPFSDRLSEKRRPAVVISGPAVAEAGFVWIAMVTSARNAAMAHDLPVVDLAAAGLPAASVVRPVKIACVEPARILRRIGTLGPDAARDVVERVRSFVGPA